MDWTPLVLTFKLSLITTVILVAIGVPLSHWLAFSRNKFKPVIEALVSMPMVLPPTVIGFYLLLAFSPSNAFGLWLDQWFGIHLIFSFEGLVFASVIYSLPFMVHPIQSGMLQLNPNVLEASYVLGKSKTQTLWKVLLPSIKPALISGMVLTFAHTVGEFGVVLMIGGNIPGQTKVASIAIYDEVEALNYGAANTYSLILFAISFAILLFVYVYNSSSKNLFLK